MLPRRRSVPAPVGYVSVQEERGQRESSPFCTPPPPPPPPLPPPPFLSVHSNRVDAAAAESTSTSDTPNVRVRPKRPNVNRPEPDPRVTSPSACGVATFAPHKRVADRRRNQKHTLRLLYSRVGCDTECFCCFPRRPQAADLNSGPRVKTQITPPQETL
ncbi:hypothetical protein F2P81_025189 [Scophthalmus maximus]|uniref:Uncharacterized protein n=1 Tax=Scophthalmus maximus TaxID=52904 RepID=A0A6A4RL30_SCOMX|nr:hypothetical protein F2P81_025189 [Scophthalmus maximus]